MTEVFKRYFDKSVPSCPKKLYFSDFKGWIMVEVTATNFRSNYFFSFGFFSLFISVPAKAKTPSKIILATQMKIISREHKRSAF